MFETYMSNHPEVDLLLREKWKYITYVNNLMYIQYFLRIIVSYQNACSFILNAGICVWNFTFNTVKHVRNSSPLFTSKYLSIGTIRTQALDVT
jgi:ABC-type iron transport system FetAB permease component